MKPRESNSSLILVKGVRTADKDEDRPKKKVRWMTRSMAEDFTREDVLYTTFKEALIYALFITSVTVCTLGRRNVQFFHLTRQLENQFLFKEFKTENDVGITFTSIRSPTDLWHFSEGHLLDSLYWDDYYDPFDPVGHAIDDDKKILFQNQLLGVPRIRQVQVKNDSCIIHEYFRRLFLTCYDLFGLADENHTPFGLEKGTAWTYNTEKQTESIPYTGKISTYGGGGYYQNFGTTKKESALLIRDLKENLWIARGTRAIFIDFSIYNANINLFCFCKLILEFPPTGGIIPSHNFAPVHLLKYVEFEDTVTFCFEIGIYIISTYFIFEELREMWYFKWKYFLQFWTYIDLIILGLAFANFLFAVFIFPNVDNALKKIVENPAEYGNLEYLCAKKTLYNEFAALLLFFSYIKIFKYISFNKTMGQLNSTLKSCALDILGFALMFAIIFLAFAELGYLLFGSQDEEFSSFGVACFSLLRTILGDFNYGPIEEANRVLAPIYFISYIFLVFFVLVNMFLAIINDTYADVKTEIAIAPDEMQMTDFLKKGVHKILQKIGCRIEFFEERAEFTATVTKIYDALTKCGFSTEEIKLFLARYNIDYMGQDGDYDFKKMMEELEEMSDTKRQQEDKINIRVSEFLEQKERVEKIEGIIIQLGLKIKKLINKLGAVNIPKTKV